MTDREAAWFALHDALPPGWRVGEATLDVVTEMWSVTARSPKPAGRGRPPEAFVQGQGATEPDALRDLAAKLQVARPTSRAT